jgi:hypothetical protein
MQRKVACANCGSVINGTEINGTEINGTEINGTEINGTEINGTEINGTEIVCLQCIQNVLTSELIPAGLAHRHIVLAKIERIKSEREWFQAEAEELRVVVQALVAVLKGCLEDSYARQRMDLVGGFRAHLVDGPRERQIKAAIRLASKWMPDEELSREV